MEHSLSIRGWTCYNHSFSKRKWPRNSFDRRHETGRKSRFAFETRRQRPPPPFIWAFLMTGSLAPDSPKALHSSLRFDHLCSFVSGKTGEELVCDDFSNCMENCLEGKKFIPSSIIFYRFSFLVLFYREYRLSISIKAYFVREEKNVKLYLKYNLYNFSYVKI